MAIAAFLNVNDPPHGLVLSERKLAGISSVLACCCFVCRTTRLPFFSAEVEKALFLRRIGTSWDNKNLKAPNYLHDGWLDNLPSVDGSLARDDCRA
ncbi:hypothetical protein RAD16_17405 [Bradyrhizobium sp. 18BD]